MPNVHVSPGRFNRDSIDAAAERESDALIWMEENLGLEVGRSRLDKARDAAAYAIELGRAAVHHPRYPRMASIQAHAKMLASPLTFVSRPVKITTAADRQCQKSRRAARQLKIMSLKIMAEQLVPLREASRLIDLSVRVLSRDAQHGLLPTLRKGRAYFVSTSDLVAYAAA